MAIIIVSRLLLDPCSGERASERVRAARETISSLYLGKRIVCTRAVMYRVLSTSVRIRIRARARYEPQGFPFP